MQDEDTDMLEREEQAKVDYVSQLLSRSQGISLEPPTEIPKQDQQEQHSQAPEAAGVRGYTNLGSRCHPILCRRPCIRFAKGKCDTEDACGYCHHSLHAPFRNLDRKQRLQVRNMDLGTLLATLLPHVRLCVEKVGFEANELIEMIQGEVGEVQSFQRNTNLDHILGQMPLSALLGLISTREERFQPLLSEQVEFLRQRLKR